MNKKVSKYTSHGLSIVTWRTINDFAFVSEGRM
jgi:hypothetical protein